MGISRKPPTIQDVARAAKVSAATVSRALSAPQRVSEPVRERVTQAVLETGYTLNVAARSLRQQRAHILLAAVPNVDNSYYGSILDAVIHAAGARGYGVLVASRLGEDPAGSLSHYFRSSRVDGLLVFDGMLQTRKLHSLVGTEGAIPLVAAYDELPDPQINSVLSDNLEAAERAVAHLVRLGHRRIGHVTGLSRNSFPNERLVGFRKAIFDHHLGLREDWIVPGDYTMQAGLAAAEHFASMVDRPTAIFAANDDLAVGLIAGLRRAGIECPRDVSVIGFDDAAFAANYSPSLTTMRQPRRQIGQLAVDTLIGLIEGDASAAAPARIVLKSELIERESTARLET